MGPLTDEQRKFIASGGFAAEYLHHERGTILTALGDPIQIGAFLRQAYHNAHEDIRSFHGPELDLSNALSEELRWPFDEHATAVVAPRLEEHWDRLTRLASVLHERETLGQADIVHLLS